MIFFLACRVPGRILSFIVRWWPFGILEARFQRPRLKSLFRKEKSTRGVVCVRESVCAREPLGVPLHKAVVKERNHSWPTKSFHMNKLRGRCPTALHTLPPHLTILYPLAFLLSTSFGSALLALADGPALVDGRRCGCPPLNGTVSLVCDVFVCHGTIGDTRLLYTF